jgi:hypothetical protein
MEGGDEGVGVRGWGWRVGMRGWGGVGMGVGMRGWGWRVGMRGWGWRVGKEVGMVGG